MSTHKYNIIHPSIQILSYQPYDKSVDWWTLGVLTYEMLVGRVSPLAQSPIALYFTCSCSFQPPFDGDDDDQLFNNIIERPVHYPRGISDPAKKIIQGVSGYAIQLSALPLWCERLLRTVPDQGPILAAGLQPSHWRTGHQRSPVLQTH